MATGARRKANCFSLMEIIVAISVITLFAGVLTPMAGNIIEDARKEHARDDCKAIAAAIDAYRRENGAYPPGPQGDATYNFGAKHSNGYDASYLNAVLFQGSGRPGGKRYLAKAIGNDPWGTPYGYCIYSQTDPYMDVVVMSMGPNKRPETWMDWTAWNRGRTNGDDIGAFSDVAR